jgi:hypothetical protein
MARLIPVDEEQSGTQKLPNARLIPVEDPQQIDAGPPPGRLERMGRGALDVTQGIKQLYLMATNKDAATTYTQRVNSEIADYERRRGKDAGFDGYRMIGNAAVQAPLVAIPGGQAAMVGRIGMGALTGALGGTAQFSEAGDWNDKALQTGVGAAAGALLPEVIRAAAKGVMYAGQAANNARRTIANSGNFIPDADLAAMLSQRGIDISKVATQTRQKLLEEARGQLQVNGDLDPKSLSLMSDYQKLGVQPTVAQATRDPRAWQTERNLAQISGVGDDLLARFKDQPGQLRAALEKMQTGEARTPFDAGRTAAEVIGERKAKSGIYGNLGRKIDDVYTAARAADGAAAELPFNQFRGRITDILDNFEDKIPSPVTRRLQDFANEDSPRRFTIAEAAKFRQLLTERASGVDPAEAKALGGIKRQLDDFMTTHADELGDSAVGAMKLFQQGVKQSASRARDFAATPMQAVVNDKVAPDDFFKKYVLNGKVDDLASMKNLFSRSDIPPELAQKAGSAWENMRGQTVQHLLERASKDGENFSQAGYRDALKALGPRLDVLFTAEERSQLSTIQRAATGLFADPATGGVPLVNRSGTAAGLANLAQKASNVPVLAQAAKPAIDAIMRDRQLSAAQQMLMGASANPALRNAAQQAYRDDMIAKIMGRQVVPQMGNAAYETMREDERPLTIRGPGSRY